MGASSRVAKGEITHLCGVRVVAPGPNWIEPPSYTQGVVGPPPGLRVTW